jgi:hypothetical protein
MSELDFLRSTEHWRYHGSKGFSVELFSDAAQYILTYKCAVCMSVLPFR